MNWGSLELMLSINLHSTHLNILQLLEGGTYLMFKELFPASKVKLVEFLLISK